MFKDIELFNLAWREAEPTEQAIAHLFTGWTIQDIKARGHSTSIHSVTFYLTNKDKRRVVEVVADAIEIILNVCYADILKGDQ